MKPRNDIRRVGLIVNAEKPEAAALARDIAEAARAASREVFAEPATARIANLPATSVIEGIRELARQTDVVLVLGGDGTMLGAARQLAGSMTPILGINIGGLGFLTGASASELEKALEALWTHQIEIDTRDLIRATGTANGQLVDQLALNDFVVSRGASSRLIELEVFVDGEVLTRYRCDGLIVCTPTGSTAYSLAAGGAVVSPNTQALTITPVCPHTLSNRSVIVSMDSVVEVKALSEKLEIFLNADGQVQLPLVFGDVIRIARSPASVRLARLPGDSFFGTLRRKLNWSGSSH